MTLCPSPDASSHAFHLLPLFGTSSTLVLAIVIGCLPLACSTPISAIELKSRMLETYPTIEAAFAEMDASANDLNAAIDAKPLDLVEFVRGSRTFRPSLTESQATAVFHALDINLDNRIQKRELLNAIALGKYGHVTTTRTITTTTVTTTALPTTTFTRTTSTTSTASTTITTVTPNLDLPAPRVFHYLPVARNTNPSPDGTMALPVFWLIFHQETGFPLVWRNWPDYDFGFFDQDGDGVVTPDEFITATRRFRGALTGEEAESVFYQLDSDHNGHVEEDEFRHALLHSDKGKFQERISLADYQQRLQNVAGVVGLLVHIQRVQLDVLPFYVQDSIRRIVALNIADAAGIPMSWVMDSDGRKGRVTFSTTSVVQERRLSSAGFEARAFVRVRKGDRPDDLLAALRLQRRQLAHDISRVPGIESNIQSGPLTGKDLKFAGFNGPEVSFVAADQSKDMRLDRDEFKHIAANFGPPLSADQAEFAFSGLDRNYDGLLTPAEYASLDSGGHYVRPPYMGEDIAFMDFIARLRSSYSTPQAAFDAIVGRPVGVDYFTQLCKTFLPPTTAKQAAFAFRGLDTDGSRTLENTEFLIAVKIGNFSPDPSVIQSAFSSLSVRKWFLGFERVPIGYGQTYSSAIWLGTILVAGILVRTAFIAWRLPGSAGVVALGIFAGVLHVNSGMDLSSARPMHEMATFLLVFCAGFSISLPDQRWSVVASATVPACMELAAIAAWGTHVMEMSMAQSVVMGMVLFAVGDGQIAARMHDLGLGQGETSAFRGHPVPRRTLTTTPAEALFALVLWSSCSGLAAEASLENADITTTILLALLRAVSSIGVGAVLGYISGNLISLRSRVELFGIAPFTDTAEEASLLTFSAGFVVTGMSALDSTGLLEFIGLESQPSVQSYALTATFAATLARTLAAKDCDAVDAALGGLWAVGQVFLFAVFGFETSANMTLSTFACIPLILPMIVFGLALRALGYLIVALMTMSAPECSCYQCRKASSSSICTDVLFYTLASTQRGVLQARLGSADSVAATLAAVSGSPNAQGIILIAARLYVIVLSVIGSVLLDAFGATLLSKGHYQERCESAWTQEEQLASEGWTARQRNMAGISTVLPRKCFRIGLVSQMGTVIEGQKDCPALPLKEAVRRLAQAYSVDASVFAGMLEKHADGTDTQFDLFNEEGGKPVKQIPSGYASIRQLPLYTGHENNPANSPPHTLTSGGALSLGRSRTTVRRLAQERLLTPRACLEAHVRIALTSDGKTREYEAPDAAVRV